MGILDKHAVLEKNATLLLVGSFLVVTVAWQQECVQGYQKKRIDTWLASFEKTQLVDNKNGAAFQVRSAIVPALPWK